MRRKLIVLLVAILCGFILIFQFKNMTDTKPWQKNIPLNTISKTVLDEKGNLYLIADSSLSLIKLSESGELIYTRASDKEQDSTYTYMYSDLTVDNTGNAYVIVTALDEFGLKVVKEHILKISADGKKTQLLYAVDVQPNESFMRVGRLQSLAVEENQLYFYSKQNTYSVLLMSIPLQSSTVQVPVPVDEIAMPDNQNLKEIIGTPSTPVAFTTKQGNMFYVQDKQSHHMFPSEGASTIQFPIELALSQHNDELFYIDNQDGNIYAMPLKEQTASSMRLDVAQFAEQHVSGDWYGLTDFTVAENGNFILTSETAVVVASSKGEYITSYDHYAYSGSYVLAKFAYWAAILLLAWLIVYTLYFIYKDVLRKKVSLIAKQLLIVIPVIVLSMFWLTQSISHSFAEQFREQTVKQLNILATNGKYLIDGDYLENIDSPRDYRSTTFLELKNRLNGLFATSGDNRGGLYNTIYRYVDDNLYIIMDDDDGVTMFQPFEINELNSKVLLEGEIVVDTWQDATGSFMYALGPIYNSDNEIVGIYETGQDLVAIQLKNNQLRSQVIEIVFWISLGLAIVITIMTIFFLSSIGKLRRSVNLIASGEWDVKVDIQTKDEVEELGDRFNMMTSAIKTYISEVTKLSGTYVKFVPQQFLKLLGKEKMSEIQLGDQQTRYMTILVCHVRNFEELSSQMTTEQNFTFINEFLNRFGPIIRNNGGFISRYIGPGMLTMFPKLTSHAIDAARQIRDQLQTYNKEREALGQIPIDIGIAIHSGEVMLGIIGEEQRMEGSVISNHVQLALDLERVSQSLGVSVLLTAQVYQAITPLEREYIRHLGELELQGHSQSVQLYDWFEADLMLQRTVKSNYKRQFEQAVEAYRNGRFYDARELFVQIMKANRHDLIAKYYFFQCDEYYQKGIKQDWHAALKI